MNATHLHLIFTHLPIVGLGFAIISNLYAIIKNSNDLKRFSLWLYIILGVFSLLAFSTGDGAEKIMETYPGITEEIIEPHENMALFFFLSLMIITGAASIILYLTKSDDSLLPNFCLYILIAAILVSMLAVETGITGGRIRHTEIRTENLRGNN